MSATDRSLRDEKGDFLSSVHGGGLGRDVPVTQDVISARSALDAVLERINRGEKVTPADLAEARGAVALAELQAEATERREHEEAEAKRRKGIKDVVDALRKSDLPKQAAEIVKLHDEAVATLAKLYAATAAYEKSRLGYAVQLRQLAPLPSDLEVSVDGIRIGGHRGEKWDAVPSAATIALEAVTRAEGEHAGYDGGSPSPRMHELARMAGVHFFVGGPRYQVDEIRAVAARA